MAKYKRKSKMGENIFVLIVVIAMIILGTIKQDEREKYLHDLIQHASYSIGEVSYYSEQKNSIIAPKFANSTGKAPSVKYKFKVGDCLCSNKYDAFTARVPSVGINEGEKYLVLYDKDNPEENRMFFDYPIKDSTDFNRFVKEFEGKKAK